MGRNWLVGFVLVLSLVRSSTSARNIPTDQTVGLSDQKTFLPCFPRKINSNNGVVGVPNDGNEETVLHANAPVEAESPGASTGLKDEKNFIYGGVGGFAGMGGYAGVVGGIPILGGLGGIGKYGGIGDAGGIGGGVGTGGLGGLPGVGTGGAGTGAVGATGVGLGGLPCHP